MVAAAMQTKTFILPSLTVLALVISGVGSDPAGEHGKEAPKQTSESPAPATEDRDDDPRNLSVCYEVFSMPISQAADLHRKGLAEEEFYKQVVKAGKIERFLVLKSKSGVKASVESVSEYIYPTEFSPPQYPESNDNTTQPPLPAAPSAFTMRPIGEEIAQDTVLSTDGRFVTINPEVSLSSLLRMEKWAKDTAEVEQPIVDTQKIKTAVTARVGSPLLLGTLNPPFENGVNPRKDQVVWFCFITVRATGESTKTDK